jgi:hypothetical protein
MKSKTELRTGLLVPELISPTSQKNHCICITKVDLLKKSETPKQQYTDVSAGGSTVLKGRHGDIICRGNLSARLILTQKTACTHHYLHNLYPPLFALHFRKLC